jgi:hypothetical protein
VLRERKSKLLTRLLVRGKPRPAQDGTWHLRDDPVERELLQRPRLSGRWPLRRGGGLPVRSPVSGREPARHLPKLRHVLLPPDLGLRERRGLRCGYLRHQGALRGGTEQQPLLHERRLPEVFFVLLLCAGDALYLRRHHLFHGVGYVRDAVMYAMEQQSTNPRPRVVVCSDSGR